MNLMQDLNLSPVFLEYRCSEIPNYWIDFVEVIHAIEEEYVEQSLAK
jgi:hypothetical protein